MGTGTVILDCGRIEVPDLGAVQCLARTTLRRKRDGWDCRIVYASRDLLRLIALVGLDGVLRAATGFPPRS